MLFSFVFLERLIIRQFFPDKGKSYRNLTFFWFALITGVHWQRELHMANHNALLFVLLLLALSSMLNRKEWIAGALIA